MISIINEIKEDIEIFTDRYRSILYIPRLTGKGLQSNIKAILDILTQTPDLEDSQMTNILMDRYKIARNTAKNVSPTLERDLLKIILAF